MKATDEIPETNVSCPACGSDRLKPFFQLARTPTHVCVLFDSRDAARQAPTGSVTLTHCAECEFIYNSAFEPDKLSFEPGYESSLAHSAVFQDFQQSVAGRLISTYDIRGKDIVEIGCGAGYFLRLICGLGGNRGVGIDPTVTTEGLEQLKSGSVRLIRDRYGPQHADLAADFICCLSVFEDIPQPAAFLRQLRQIIGNRNIPVYFEVFNGARAFAANESWSIHYEQCNYFTISSLRRLFEHAHFEIQDAGHCYQGDQYIFVEARPAAETSVTPDAADQDQLTQAISTFAAQHRKTIDTWLDRVEHFRRAEQRVVTWGSGGKGISFLNALGADDVIKYVVDINPQRQGKYIPGSGQHIVPPEFLVQHRPQTIIVTNKLYLSEIKAQVQGLGVDCDYLVA